MTRTPATSSSTSRRQSSTTTINRSHHHDPLNSDIHPRPTGQDGCRYRPCCLTPSTGGFEDHQVHLGFFELRDQRVPSNRVVDQALILGTPASIEMPLGHVNTGVRTLIATRYPTLRMHAHDWQLFGLHGWTRRAEALTEGSRTSFQSSEAKQVWRIDREKRRGAGAVDKWTVQAALEPARLPWTTLRVAHRASLCPLATQPSHHD